MYCIDASVLINSEIEREKFHEYSKRLMEIIREQNVLVVVPEILGPEIASAIVRGTNNIDLAINFVDELQELPNFVFIPIDRELSNLASKFAAEYRLRGCDAIYVSTAFIFNVKLISLDKQQIERASKCIDVLTPGQELKNLNL